DAWAQGLTALTLQSREPWEFLQLALWEGIRLVLNHRVSTDSPAGHYSVLLRADTKSVVVHDPLFGPARRLARAEFLDLWQPRPGGCEITGGVLVAFAPVLPQINDCCQCGEPIPESLICPGCWSPIPLQPGSILGCVAADCRGRTWERV